MKQRIVTAIIAASVFLPIVIYGGWPFLVLTYILATVGLFELIRMKKMSLFSFPSIVSFLVLWLFLYPYEHMINIWILIIGLFLLLIYTVISKNAFTFDDVGFMIASLLYVGVGFYSFFHVREAGLSYIFYALFLIWATDSGAYFIGRALGKRKLWEHISPNKTVEGAVGGILCALFVVSVYEWLSPFAPSFPMLLIATVILSVFGQLGDLVESAFKRHYGVKDSGAILPGHGGILDRFDSLLFILPILHLFYLIV
ncbi:phosphatidate cytidylyltransferase [Anoxybacillus ayderensis]|uniref:phosphatidate cytidylyltransferase n=1 Tax=Anoxybacillus ayderensis TaxID=265546 RepID=UPI002E1B42C5|nr:phosphatidate cytidylyltransferase [Anoxybacillus ayderensis]